MTMLESENQEEKQLALDLVKYTYFSNGYAFGPNSFFHLIPIKFWTDSYARDPKNKDLGLLDKKGRTFNEMMYSAYRQIEADGIDSTLVKRFIKQFAQNTGDKSMIIKTVDLSQGGHVVKDGILHINKKTSNPYLIQEGNTPASFLKTRSKGTIKLYRLVTKAENGDSYVYKQIPLLGSTNFVTEYNLRGDIKESIIDKISKTVNAPDVEKGIFHDIEIDLLTEPSLISKTEDSGIDESVPSLGDLVFKISAKDTGKPVSYKDYFMKAGKTNISKENMLSEEEFNSLDTDEQQNAFECL